jgi:Holliday junction resolvase RusA-like endonuclease
VTTEARVDACSVILATGPGYVSQLINANERGHWAKREARRRYWLDTTVYRLRGAPPFYLDRHVHIGITLYWPDRRRRDVNNWQPTAKAIVDGIVKAKVITDDSDRYVTGPDMRRGYGPHRIVLTITPTGDPT